MPEILFSGTTLNSSQEKEEVDAWGRLWAQIKTIEHRHRTDTPETPKLSVAVIQGTRRLIRSLEAARQPLPTVMTGTCDATITLEWHEAVGEQTFRSLDVLNEDEAEEFVLYANGNSDLQTVTF